MDRNDRAILVAMSIGDGYIKPGNKKKSTSAELRVKHSENQKGYLEWKAEEIKRILGGTCNIKSERVKLKGSDKVYQQFRFLKSHKYFNQIRKWLYQDGKKIITPQVLDMLNPQGLAIWFMDDGCQACNRNKNGNVSSIWSTLAIQTSAEHAQEIAEHFLMNYDIRWVVFPSVRQYALRANTENSHKLSELISPYLVPCMRYKIRYSDAILGHECSAPPVEVKI